MAGLNIVALPIGHSQDITIRAMQTLTEVDFIACEDTRKLKDLLRRTGIETEARIFVYNKDNEKNSARGLVDLLQQGQSGALVADAGTPKISDPGHDLVKLCYEQKIEVKAVPGVSALTCALSICPFAVQPLLFLGFLPPKDGKRIKILHNYATFQGTVAFYESVHKIEKLIDNLMNTWGNGEVFIGRELTKQYEETFWGSLEEATEWVKKKKGEFVVIIRKSD